MKLKQNHIRKLKQLWLLLTQYSFWPARPFHKAVIIIMLHNERLHGGFADRLKGIMTAYFLAKELQYDFKICINPEKFMLPRFLESDFYISKQALNFNAWKSRPVYLYNTFKMTRTGLLQIFRQQNIHYHLYCNIDYLPVLKNENIAHQLAWQQSFAAIFSFSQIFVNEYERLFGNRKNVIGIHLRFHSLLGDFEEVKNKFIAGENQLSLIKKCLEHVDALCLNEYNDGILVVSDSSRFLHQLEAYKKKRSYAFKLKILKGSIAHLDVDFSETVLEKTILDFYLLHRCKTIYQILEPQMHNSQFSKYAALLGGANYVLKRY